jgi:putative transposase
VDAAGPRNLTDVVDGFFRGKRYLIHDRDPLYTNDFLAVIAGSGIEAVKLPPSSPNLNEYTERFVRTIKESCLDKMIFFGEDALRHTIREFLAHYHYERNHQGLDNRLLIGTTTICEAGPLRKRERVGGLLNYYYREAA